MDRTKIINSDKSYFLNYIISTNKLNPIRIIELFNDEGIELLSKTNDMEDKICYLLVWTNVCDELLKNKKFLDLLITSNISYYYASLSKLKDETYTSIINEAIELNMPNHLIAILFSYFNKNYKLKVIDNWPYSDELLYEVFKKDKVILGPRIIQKPDFDLLSHDINIASVFAAGKKLFWKDVESRNLGTGEKETIKISSHVITNQLAEKLWNENNVFSYRKILNDAVYSCDPEVLNKYAKRMEDNAITSAKENELIYPYDKLLDYFYKMMSLNSKDKELCYNLKREILRFADKEKLYDINLEMIDSGEIVDYVYNLNNKLISNYIIDYHFEENYFNIMYDLRELLNFYNEGNLNNIPKDRIDLYNKLIKIDNLNYNDKLSLHEKLKKYNMLEFFYDDMSFARKTVFEAIKNKALTMDELKKYKDEELSEKYDIDIYNIDNNPFIAIVKSGEHKTNDLPGGHSFSIVGNGCVGTFGDNSFVYDSNNLNSNQIVHMYPMDSFTMYEPFRYSEKATDRVQPLMMPEKILDQTLSYNELLILEQGTSAMDINDKIPKLNKIAVYCVDKISDEDIQEAKINGIGILLVNSKDLKIDKSNLEKDYWEYNYFDGSFEQEKHENNR